MPTLARSRLDVADVKPRVKPEPDVIDLCDSDDATPTPSSRPEPKSAPVRSRRKVADRARVKYEDDDSDATDGPNRADGDGSEESDDDFRGSKRKAVKKGRAASAAPGPSAHKLYAIARIATLATDGVASVSESEAKLAGVSAGILSRIQKSLALAKHPGTGEAEAQQALRLATRLMSSQNLTQADLLASSDAEANQARAGMSIVEIVSQTSASPRNESWANQIAVAVNLFFDVKAYSTSYANRSRLSWTFYGLAVNTVAAAHAFEMVHNQVLTWAYEKAAAKLVSGKTGKNSYCQGVAAGLIALAKKEKKEEMRLAIEAEKKRLDDAHKTEQAQVKKEKERLRDPPQPASVKPEPSEDLSSQSQSGSRSVKLEDVVDEQDVKPSRNGVKQEMSDVDGAGYGRWSEGYGASAFGHTKLEDGMDYDDDDDDAATDRFYDMDDGAHGSDPHGALGEDIKPHFDEALERDIIDLTDDLDTAAASEDTKPKLEPKIEADDGEGGAGWHSSGQLMRFRQDAEKIADDYLASQHSGLKLRKRAKTTYKRDSHAFEQGRVDARKIDVKRKRIQN
ncbi:hypothetical protein PANT_19c00133 [Moesziomyces antarcticus T-34]|uniref:Uncharacterized protein n=1 Tax=Pseudozyma antarctica (strain T-34) TaxID=1151754 RepID=M9MFH0_PSEA3|nr:hypothetical protein PANT_19c00133 [Moesziomyces antarcticus T-34]